MSLLLAMLFVPIRSGWPYRFTHSLYDTPRSFLRCQSLGLEAGLEAGLGEGYLSRDNHLLMGLYMYKFMMKARISFNCDFGIV